MLDGAPSIRASTWYEYLFLLEYVQSSQPECEMNWEDTFELIVSFLFYSQRMQSRGTSARQFLIYIRQMGMSKGFNRVRHTARADKSKSISHTGVKAVLNNTMQR